MLSLEVENRPSISELFENAWVTQIGPMKSRCTNYVELTEEDVAHSVTTVPKLETLIMVKQMLKRHSFKNPFAFKKEDPL